MTTQTYGNVWDALEQTPERSASLTMRADLIIAIGTRLGDPASLAASL